MKGAKYVVEDGGSPADRTVLEVPLAAPVAPGEEVTMNVEFDSRLPRVVARTGFGGDFHFVAQWFPKLGVWQDVGEGGATVPAGTAPRTTRTRSSSRTTACTTCGSASPRTGRVGATGRLDPAGPDREADGSLTYAYHADDVHDFAWVAGSEGTVSS